MRNKSNRQHFGIGTAYSPGTYSWAFWGLEGGGRAGFLASGSVGGADDGGRAGLSHPAKAAQYCAALAIEFRRLSILGPDRGPVW